MPRVAKKGAEERVHRAEELFGLVRNALQREYWSDETCGKVAAKLWCLGYNSVERLRMFLFSNSVNSAPQRDLLDELAKAQCENVHDGKLSDTCKPYLLYEWRGKQVDFLHLLAYVRRVYDDDPIHGGGTISSPGAAPGAPGAVPGAEQSTAAVARPPSTQGMEGCGALGTDKRGGQDADEGDRPVKRTKVDARHLERHNYTRRSLRRVSEEMKWSGKDEFFKVLSDD